MSSSASAGTSTKNSWSQAHVPDAFQVEACGWIVLGGFVGFCLSVADPPDVVPPNFAFTIGMLGGNFACNRSKMVAGVVSMLPLHLSVFLMCMAGATVLLAAATISNELMVVVCALWAIVGSLSWGGPMFFRHSSCR